MRRAVLLLVVALAGCAVDRYEVRYDDFVAARQQDAVDRGWVPEWLPESTTDLHEIHDPGTGRRVLTATLPEPEAFAEACPRPADDVPRVPFGVEVPDSALDDVRDCGEDGVGALEGTALYVWRGATED